jgi:D-glycero-D-manno-heptose 1,7-bisphosphate phosphatase
VGVNPLDSVRRAVFLDRDGVLNKAIVKGGKPFPPATTAEVELIPGVGSALALLKKRNLLLIAVSNQPDVARGTCTRGDVERINDLLSTSLPLDGFFVCFHDDVDECFCRKPRPGLFLEAAERFGVDLAASFAIGDRWRDVEAAANAGVQSVFIDYGYSERTSTAIPDAIVTNVMAGCCWIVDQVSSPCVTAGSTGR